MYSPRANGEDGIEVLIVEDSPTQAERLRYILEGHGYQVTHASNGLEAMELITRRRPNIVLTDVLMPEMDGHELCRRIKGDDSLKHIPVILVTSLSDPADVVRGLESGADNFIVKPYDEAELLARVQYILLNRALDDGGRSEMGVEIAFAGARYYITSPRLQILNLLLSSFETAVRKNRELERLREELQTLNDSLERTVETRTAALQGEIAERERVNAALRESEEQLRQSQRMDAIGRLAGGIAHDFNNLLTAILGYTDLVQAELGPDSPCLQGMREIRGAADRATALTRQLLAFSRRQALQPRVLNLNEVTGAMAGLLGRVIGEDISLVFKHTPDLWPVEADPGQIEQVILNLAVNARDAMPRGGKLTIETANVDLDEDYTSSHLESRPGSHVMLAVSDTGCGIPKELLPHIFEPFFTTKEPGKGTGLGLSTVYGIVKQSGGSIWIYSEPDRGTSVKIYLPRVDKAVDPSVDRDPKAGAAAQGGNETILVVEDEPAVRALTVRVLGSHGYTVLSAGSPQEALELEGEYAAPVHLVLTDVVLPGMNGRALVDALIERRSGPLKVLFMSGYTRNAIIHDGRLDPNIAFLEKPFMPDSLVRKVRELLDEAQPERPE